MKPLKASEGFTMDQLLNTNGFTMDTSDFVDLMVKEDDSSENMNLNEEDLLLRHLYLEDDLNEEEEIAFAAMSFDEIRENMYPIDDIGEVCKMIKKEGAGNVVPQEAQVTVKYVGYFEAQDEPFDSTYLHQDKQAVFRLGKGEMIPGLEIAISTMKKFEKAVFLIQPSMAYGELGCPPRIPPNAEVLFKVELISYLDKEDADDYEEFSNEEKKKFSVAEKLAKKFLSIGMTNFKKHKFKQAIREYNRAVSYLEGASLQNNEDENQMNKILSRALTNLIICYNKVDKPKLACSSFERLPSKSGKAYFQYAKALMTLGEHDVAMKNLQKALAILPDCQDVKKLIHEVEALRQKDYEFFKRFARNSLQIKDAGNDSDTFESIANEMCDSFIKSTLLRQAIPRDLSSEKMQCLKGIAATRELSITKQTFRGVDTYFLTKKNYHTSN